MFQASYATVFFIYLLLWIVYLIILWVRESWRNDIRNWSLSEGKLCICNECRYAFLVNPRENTTICPKCGQFILIKNHKTKKNYHQG
ncbi:MAG TPA: hypothetical protein DD381_06450 [Lentisphaeria bacterium]|nr:MAG: hypothetical protein A2X47_13330 [Lentisphaerae bacterium GWF2_38_69]HBM15966.1 hypothetical protein [Lentisphaeria bacterium]